MSDSVNPAYPYPLTRDCPDCGADMYLAAPGWYGPTWSYVHPSNWCARAILTATTDTQIKVIHHGTH